MWEEALPKAGAGVWGHSPPGMRIRAQDLGIISIGSEQLNIQSLHIISYRTTTKVHSHTSTRLSTTVSHVIGMVSGTHHLLRASVP